jgi:RNA polymerase sigma factor (sigma-70 family)
MEGYTLRPQSLSALRGPSPLLRLASDERLIELTRGGQQAAFEVLVSRYHARLLAFCRHMLRSREDAEDVLQEVFAAAFNAIMADTREINARPWLYRIARNRSLNHLRRNTAIGVDSMDQHFADAGQSTSEKVHKREEFRLLLEDIGHLPETQRSALVLREMDALSYEQIAHAMETTVPGVKSLLVRARIGLAEAAEARKLTCSEVRLELGAAAEGISSLSAPVRRHVKDCERCRGFRTQLRANNRALAAIFPLGPLILLKKTILFKLGVAKFLGFGGAGAGSGAATATAAGAGAGGAVATGTAAVATTGGLGSLAAGAVVVKAVAVVATVAVVAAVGASIHLHSGRPHPAVPAAGRLVAAVPRAAGIAISPPPTLASPHHRIAGLTRQHRFVEGLPPALFPANTVPAAAATTTAADMPVPPVSTQTTSAPATTVQASTPAASATPTTQEISTTTTFPSTPTSSAGGPTAATGATGSTGSTATTATGATGATGATSTSGSTGSTGSTGSAGSGEPSYGPDQGGASGPTGASAAGS